MNQKAPLVSFGTYYQGDSIRPLTIKLTEPPADPPADPPVPPAQIPLATACVQWRTLQGQLVYQYANTISSGALVLEGLTPEITRDFPEGKLRAHVVVTTTADSANRTLFVLELNILTNYGGCTP